MMETVSAFEAWVSFYLTTRRDVPEVFIPTTGHYLPIMCSFDAIRTNQSHDT